ncbi:MAG: DNA polymerase III subunit delta [Marinilabiliales bacterium]|nr:MAG: DNA polymerase III subunit delta [Marinilabiliales bacterium]
MTFENIISDLKNKIYKPIYLFYGEESYFIDELTNYIAKNVLTEAEKSFNQTILYGKDVNVTNVIELSRRFPMMANMQVVIVKEAQDIKKFADFEPYVSNPVKSTILVFSFKNKKTVDKRTKVISQISKQGVMFESKRLYERDIYPWITSKLNAENISIHPEALRLLYESIGADLTRISAEIKKLLITLPEDTTQIQKEDVAQNIGINRDFNIFELQKALSYKDSKKVYKIVDYFSKDAKNNPLIATVARLFDYFRKVILYHSLTDKGKNNAASVLGVNPYFVDEYRVAAKNYSLSKLIIIVSYLRDTDAKLKGVGAVNANDSDLSKELFYKILH